ncbi:putative indole-3-glycerol phosphate synthase [Candidatus Tremblaya phenacola PAVE]|nr:putative indole-3-glycerol phosphate synthase [Candidatus Tremblaya phenacola PAVE]
MSFLNHINKHKAEETKSRKTDVCTIPCPSTNLTRNQTPLFFEVLSKTQTLCFLTEMKRLSPSKGMFRRLLKTKQLVSLFCQNNSSCLSVLTDQRLFGGDPSHLIRMREEKGVALLRKDFVITKYQALEALVLGAAAILLVASLLSRKKADRIGGWAERLGLSVVLEVNNHQELVAVRFLAPKVVGINNRDINTFKISFIRTVKLASCVPSDCSVIIESGIKTERDLWEFVSWGFNCFLIGELLMGCFGVRNQ